MTDRVHYFTPSDVGHDLSRAARRCVAACCAFLGFRPPPNRAHPSWSNILRHISPEGCDIRSFDNLSDMKEEYFDYLYVATMNKSNSGVGHAVVMYRAKNQMGSSKFHLFNPGNHSPYRHIDLNRQRDTAEWNYICAAFMPGANIPVKNEEIILDSSDNEENLLI